MRSPAPRVSFWAAAVALLLAVPAAGAPQLVDAARAGELATARDLLAQGADASTAEADGSSALLWAAYRDDLAMADLLIGAGADAGAANDLGATPLWAASQNGSTTMVARLLEAGADPDAALLAGETPLMVAARGGFPQVAEQLLDAGADVNHTASRDQTALMWAAAGQHPEVVAALLRHGADVRATSAVWQEMMATEPHGHLPYNRWIPHGGDTALMFAARAGDLASARLLVEAGADVDDADAWGVSATMLAAHANHAGLVEYLLDEGANPDVSTPGFTALHAAVMHRNEPMVRALIAHGVDVDHPVDTWTPTRRSSDDYSFYPELVGAAPIWLAARFSTPAIVRLLLDAGADPRFVHHGEWMSRSLGTQAQTPQYAVTTTLMAAAGMGGGYAWASPAPGAREDEMIEAARLLVEAGVDVNAEDVDGRTALDAVTRAGFDRVADYLISQGATQR